MKSGRRVVVTGMGMMTPLGLDVKSTWDGILKGKSGITKLDGFDLPGPDIETYRTRIAGKIKGYDSDEHFTAKDRKKMDIFLEYGIVASRQAWKDAGLEVTEENADRIGVCVGSGVGGMTTLEATRQVLDKSGIRRVSPFCIPATIVNMISGHVSIELGMKGPNLSIVTACTTGTHNIGAAARMIAYGDADVMLAGGAEKCSTSIGMSGFAAARALSTRNDDPEKASRPWDKGRDGFVLSDGAGVLVLEEYEHAKARGANIYAELAGFGMNADAFHMTTPSGKGAIKCMKNAIEDAQINIDEVDYINAHGTSTPAGDVQESIAAETVLGNHAKNIVMSSTKSMVGHMLGAAGAVESIFSILAMRDQVAPPTINLDELDDNCNLDYAAHNAKPMEINVAMSNSFGFGGTNGTLIFKKI
jgi:3-oxoacyl-[acyl-carrier-protein] synthase II